MTAKEKASRGESFRGAKQTIGDLPGVEGVHAPIINMALVSSNSVRKLVNQRFDDDRYIPYNGEIIVVQLLKTLLVPCLHSLLSAICRLVSLAAIITTQLYCHPKYSQLRPYLTSTGWLLDKPADLERTPPEHAQLIFPTLLHFGEPLKVGGWKSRKLSLVQVVPEVVILITTTLVRILDGLS